jgi:hypothetical protein
LPATGKKWENPGLVKPGRKPNRHFHQATQRLKTTMLDFHHYGNPDGS